MSAITAPWQSRQLQQALSQLQRGQLGHAQLLCGPARMGKQDIALAIANAALCKQRDADGQACGQCRSCQLYRAGTHPDFLFITLEVNEKTDKQRTEIVIDQIRRLSEWMSKTAQMGGAQVAVISPADAMNNATANALLKTLEEPHDNRFLLLCADAIGHLPMTIRSRCQRMEFRLPPRAEAETWLAELGHAKKDIHTALDAADGHPGLAREWIEHGGLALRENVRKDLERLREGRIAATALAQEWVGDGQAPWRLWHAAEWVRIAMAQRLGARAGDAGLGLPEDLSALDAWLEGANRLRDQWDAPLRNDLLLTGLLREWRILQQTQQPQAGAAR